jgi:anthranilate synthase component 2
MKIFVLDNYDSFTYNLVEAIRNITGLQPTVKRNDQFELEELEAYDKIILSPGPGIPDEAGLLKATIETYKSTKSILGICLGMQAIAEVFGAKLFNLPEVYHGISTPITVTAPEDRLFQGMDSTFDVGRYHSWAVDPGTVPPSLKVTAVDELGVIMAINHNSLDVKGLQFHPESIMTNVGITIIKNWLNNRSGIVFPTRESDKFNHEFTGSSKMFC